MYKINDELYHLSFEDVRAICRYYSYKHNDYAYLYENGCNGWGVKDIEIDYKRMKENYYNWYNLIQKLEDGYELELHVIWHSTLD